jgi:serine phosphatase RsbU (regulator of sigma subunit)
MIRKPNVLAEFGIPRHCHNPPRNNVNPARNLAITGVIMLLTLLGGTGWLVLDRRCSDLSAAQEDTFSLAAALAGQTSRTFEEVNVVLSDLLGRIHDDDVKTPEALNTSMDAPAIQRMLHDYVTIIKRIDTVAAYDAAGRLIVWSREGPVANVMINDQDYFLALRDNAVLGNFISKPEPDRLTGTMTVLLARRMTAPGGQFLGIVVGAIKQSDLANQYDDVSQANGHVVALVRRDGELIVRQPASDSRLAQRPAKDPPPSTLQAERQSAGLLLPGPLTDGASVVSSYPVHGFPLFIMVSRTQSSILAHWRQQSWGFGVGAVLVVLSLLAAIRMLRRQIAQRERSEANLVAQRDDLERELIKRTRGLVANEALHRDVAEVASDWIWETNASSQLTFLSKRFGVTSGIAWSDATDRPFSDLVEFGFDAVGMAEIIAVMQARGSFHDVVCSVFPKSGQPRFWRLSGRPFLEPGTDHFAGYRGTGTDVTALIEQEAVLTAARVQAEAAEQEARQARSRLVDAIEAIPEGFVLHDADDRLVLSNARYREIQGLPPEFMQPGVTFETTLRAIYQLHFATDGRTEDEWVADRLAQHRSAGTASTEQRLVNGRWLQVEERRTSDGGTVGIRIDVTDARALEAAEHERARASAEMQAARMLQTSLLPSAHLQQAIIERSGLDIASRTANCSELGGDLWGMSDLDEGRIGVYTVDFTGHGTAAALNTVRLHTLIHELRSTMLEPDQFLKALNERLTELLPPGTFATMFYGIVDSCQDCFTYAVAGSPPPVIRSRLDLPLTILDSAGMPLGIVAGADYVCAKVHFEAGGLLFLYSDMLTDFVDGQGKRGGDAGAFNLIRQCIGASTAQVMVDRICAPFLDDLTMPLTDDLTVICIRRP